MSISGDPKISQQALADGFCFSFLSCPHLGGVQELSGWFWLPLQQGQSFPRCHRGLDVQQMAPAGAEEASNASVHPLADCALRPCIFCTADCQSNAK